MRNKYIVFGVLVLVVGFFAGCTGDETAATYAVSGKVADSDGNGVEAVTLTFGDFGVAETHEDGKWVKEGLSGIVDVALVKDGWSFEPPNRTIAEGDSGVDFVGTLLQYPLTIEIEGEGTVDHEDAVSDLFVEREIATIDGEEAVNEDQAAAPRELVWTESLIQSRPLSIGDAYELASHGQAIIPYLEYWTDNDPDLDVRYWSLFAMGVIDVVSDEEFVERKMSVQIGSIVKPKEQSATIFEYPGQHPKATLRGYSTAYVLGIRETIVGTWLFISEAPFIMGGADLSTPVSGWVDANDIRPYLADLGEQILVKYRYKMKRFKNVKVFWVNNSRILRLLEGPNQAATVIRELIAGDAIEVIEAMVPSPTKEEGPRGGLQMYDKIRLLDTGEVGWISRAGDNVTPWF